MSINDTPAWLAPARAEFARLRPDAEQDAELLARLTQQLQALQKQHRAAEAHEPRWLRRLAWGSSALTCVSSDKSHGNITARRPIVRICTARSCASAIEWR